MKHSMLNKLSFLAILFVGMIFLIACAKDKIPVIEQIEPTKWEKLTGDYQVYDTLGNFLYQMSISHIHNDFNNKDSLYFQNLDDNFNFGCLQPYSIALYNNFFQFGHHEQLFDNLNNSWKMIDVANLPYNNFQNDTIKLKFRITNINYYLSDLVPYCDTTKIQIAVKQH